MVTVTISCLTLNLASDLSQVRSFPFQQSATSSPAIQVKAQQYAGGNFRMVRQRGRQSLVQYTISCVTPDDRRLLEFDWVGQLLVIRDDRGRKFWGFYTAPQVTDHQYDDECEVSLSFAEVTRSEVV